MFRTIARAIATTRGTTVEVGARELFQLTPMQLAVLLEDTWDARVRAAPPELGHPDRRSDLEPTDPALRDVMFPRIPAAPPPAAPPVPANVRDIVRRLRNLRWDHLIYAYLVENTRIHEVFRRVLADMLTGENLGTVTGAAQAWLRSTEELFYREPVHYSIWSMTSLVRPSLPATVRNAYYRMFGMDLNHGNQDNVPVPYPKPEASNREFVSTLQQFLREVWIGIEYFTSTTGSKPTDDQAIANAARRLQEMLLARRIDGNLSREEFAFVSMMSWFHLTVEFNSPIVAALRAEATSPEQRLFKIADRANLPAHGKAGDFFALAEPMSRILINIEQGLYSNPAAVGVLYTPGSAARQDMAEIIARWASATTFDPKAAVRGPMAAARS